MCLDKPRWLARSSLWSLSSLNECFGLYEFGLVDPMFWLHLDCLICLNEVALEAIRTRPYQQDFLHFIDCHDSKQAGFRYRVNFHSSVDYRCGPLMLHFWSIWFKFTLGSFCLLAFFFLSRLEAEGPAWNRNSLGWKHFWQIYPDFPVDDLV